MGHTTHRAVLVFTWDNAAEKDIEAFREEMPEHLRHLLVGPVSGIVNTWYQYVFLSSGSKDGWSDHDLVDEWQDRFVKLFEKFRYDDGSTSFEVLTVQVGDGERDPLLYDSPKTYLAKGGAPYVPQYQHKEP